MWSLLQLLISATVAKNLGDRAEGDAFWRVCSGFGGKGTSLPMSEVKREV